MSLYNQNAICNIAQSGKMLVEIFTPYDEVMERRDESLTKILESNEFLENLEQDSRQKSLFCAIKIGNLELFEKIIALGVDVNYKNHLKSTYLIESVRVKDEDMIEILLDYGAVESIDDVNNDGDTALTYALGTSSEGLFSPSASPKIATLLIKSWCKCQCRRGKLYGRGNPSKFSLKNR